MRYIQTLAVAIILLGAFSACKKEKKAISQPDCDNLIAGLSDINPSVVTGEINKLTVDLDSNPVPGDPGGHEANLQILADRLLAACSDLTAIEFCYECVLSEPPQSEMTITILGSSGITVQRKVDFMTPANGVLEAVWVHE